MLHLSQELSSQIAASQFTVMKKDPLISSASISLQVFVFSGCRTQGNITMNSCTGERGHPGASRNDDTF